LYFFVSAAGGAGVVDRRRANVHDWRLWPCCRRRHSSPSVSPGDIVFAVSGGRRRRVVIAERSAWWGGRSGDRRKKKKKKKKLKAQGF
jgi:hypothetical protein